jgi:2-iminobutanoate/2-iminopropanoate deaminase
MGQRIINPKDSIYPATEDYVHAIEVSEFDRMVFVSGTMGLEANGKAALTLQDQLTLIWGNIRRILAEANMGLEDIVRVTSYLTDPTFAQANQDARLLALGALRVPTTAIVVGTLSPDWLVEVEVIAAG